MAAIDLETIARLGRIALAAGEYYAFCRTAPVLAEAAPLNAEWQLGYLRALTKLGLNAAAGQLIEQMPEQLRQDAAIQELAAAVAGAPTGRIAWSSVGRCFAANLAALERRDAGLAAAVREAWRQASERYELHRARDGNYQIREAAAVWPPRWLPALDDHRGLAKERFNWQPGGLIPPALLFDGIGMGWEALDAYRQTKNVFLGASSAIYIVEPSLESLGLVLHLHDWRELLGDERVLWFFGGDAIDRFRRLLVEDETWPIPELHVQPGHLVNGTGSSVVGVVSNVVRHRQARVAEVTQAIEQKYTGRDAAWWARRFAEAVGDPPQADRAASRPLRILGLTSRHTTFLQYSMRDCLRALERLGHQTRLIIEPADHRRTDVLTSLEAELAFEPDLILLLSRLRSESRELLHPAIPSVTWDQDTLPWVFGPDVHRDREHPQLAWNDFLMGFAARGVAAKLGWPEHRCRYCAMAGSIDTYSAEPVPPEELESYRCDVSYVSHSSATVQEEIAAIEEWLPDGPMRAIFRRAVERLLPEWLAGGQCPGPVMTAILDACQEHGKDSLSFDELSRLTQPVHRIAGRAFRHVALGWVADWADRTGRVLHLWGKGWERHPRLARYARGPAANGEELRRIYQASQINLQLMSTGFFHQRALDGLMAGGFFLGRRTEADQSGPALRELVALIDRHGIDSPRALAAVADVEARRKIVATLRRFGEDERALCPQLVESRRQSALDDFIDEKVPGFEDLLFSSAAELERRAECFLASPALRVELAAGMRQVLVKSYSYDVRMKEMLLFLREGFRIEAEVGGRSRQEPLAREIPAMVED